MAFLFLLYILASAHAVEFSLEATVIINPPPLNLDVNVEVLTETVYVGEELLFRVDLAKQGTEEITVDLNYQIFKNKKLILTKQDSMDLIDFNSKEVAILIPADTKPGRYTLIVTATYFNQSDSDEDKFIVRKQPKDSYQRFFGFFEFYFANVQAFFQGL